VNLFENRLNGYFLFWSFFTRYKHENQQGQNKEQSFHVLSNMIFDKNSDFVQNMGVWVFFLLEKWDFSKAEIFMKGQFK
jgi:hypothetical protein